MAHLRAPVRGLAALARAAAVTACSTIGDDGGGDAPVDRADGSGPVVLVTHSSFALPDALVADLEQETGVELEVRKAGDAGALTNKLVLSKDNPLGDLAFGVDNTFASRALDAGVFAPADVPWPAGAERHALPGAEGDGVPLLAPVDSADVCVNVDDTWFADEGLTPPRTLEDLADPAYEGLFVTPGATTSSPGMAFLLATIAEYGDGWTDYWQRLLDNDVKVTDGWSDAYQVDFTQGGGRGDRPIVVSYDSSPAFTVSGGRSTTSALLDTCFGQTEYAGVLAGADNPEGAERVLAWLLSEDVQAALPESMYVFPVADDVALPRDWARYAVQPDDPYTLDPAEITERRDEWLRTWSDLVSR